MKKYIYITSSNNNLDFISAYTNKEDALKYSSGIKRMLKIEVDVPDIEETIHIAEEEEFTNEDK